MKTTYAFIDAANLFYGGEKSLGWKIDYRKLIQYLKEKYKIKKVFYYAGIELHGFKYSLLENKPLDLEKLLKHLLDKLKNKDITEEEILIISKHIRRVKFYLKLKRFGYFLQLKPTKIYWDEDKPVKKANCDADMTLDLVRYINEFKEALILSGDGDFVRALLYLQSKNKRIYILARGERSAREIKKLAGSDFRDFHKLRSRIEFK
ncbi:MAG: NYN domain-containing protein [Candidatus Roizmanbacteria bacterium]|nr:MAG: NYN domain-containing protein [Candidatus Roizmanbacteria bacterium]